MKVAVIGTGYVGLVLGACLADTGNDVVCADLDAAKVFLSVGTVLRDESLNVSEHAALTAVCLGILNLDEALTRE